MMNLSMIIIILLLILASFSYLIYLVYQFDDVKFNDAKLQQISHEKKRFQYAAKDLVREP